MVCEYASRVSETLLNELKTLPQTNQMAEPGEVPLNPIAPLAVPTYGSEIGQSAAGKRRREDEYPQGVMLAVGDGDESASKRRAKAQDVLFRIVVPSRQIGKVIGKEGCRIQKIREETKATIKIADAVAVSSLNH